MTHNYPRSYRLSFIAILVLIISIFVFDATRTYGGGLVAVILAIGIGLLVVVPIFVRQLRDLRSRVEPRFTKLARNEIWLLVAFSLAIPLAAFIGDRVGLAHFGTNGGTNTGQSLTFLLSIVFVLAALLIVVLTLTNLIYFASGTNSRPLNVIGRIGYWLLWLVTAVTSYFACTIAYSLDDPSTE